MICSQQYVDQEDQDPPTKEEKSTSLTTTTQEDGHDDVGGALGAPGQDGHPMYTTTTPCKGSEV